ncbi:MAG: MATE family efflux transporter [Kiritimatiellae bacterium]|nr:MATE family efflux transporter [Kiritimatiellia bacterium]
MNWRSDIKPGGIADVLKVATPLFISMGSFSLMQFCDRVFLAKYSYEALQAALPAGILCVTLLCFFNEIANYSSTFVAQCFGANQSAMIARVSGQGILFAVASFPFLMILLFVGQYIIQHNGHPPGTIVLELDYFNILMSASVLHVLVAAVSSFYTGRGITIVTMVVNVAGNILNISLDYCLIFGKFGFPEMGMKGAAIATVTSTGLIALVLFALFLKKSNREKYKTHLAFKPDIKLIKRMLRFGTPSAINITLEVSAYAFFILLIGKLGSRALAASNIAFSINNIIFMPLLGLSIATSTIVGRYQGQGNPEIAKKSTFNAVRIGMLYMAIIGILFATIPAFFVSFFTGTGPDQIDMAEILPLTRTFLLLMATWGLFDVVNLVVSGALKGAGDTRFVMIYTLAMSWGVWIPGELLLMYYFKTGIMAQWIWFTLFVMMVSVGYILRFRSGKWKDIEVIEK